MSYIPEEVINEVKANIDIVELISQYVSLNKRGTNFIASCPFHEDRNPSFSVSQSKQIYKCFSCGRGGNVFGFLQEIEGISFPEAVSKAAEFANITIDSQYINTDHQHSKQENILYDIHNKVGDFYHYYLLNTKNGEEAFQYLSNREISKDNMLEFQLGLSPSNSKLVIEYLLKEGYSSESLLKSGIFYQNDQGDFIDRFRERIIIPLRNARGQIVAFSGRVFGENSDNTAKYLNSPETSIFKKGNMLFNLDKARLPIRNKNQVLVAEGFMDVISLSVAGFENAVASMGTSLTTDHLNQLAKMTNSIVLAFDGDSAGQKATSRAFEQAVHVNKNIDIKALQIPNQLDPDDWIKQKGKESFQQLINQSISQFEFNRDFYKNDYNLNNEYELAQYIEKIIELISQIKSPIEQQLRIQDLVQEYNLSESLISEQVNRQRNLERHQYSTQSTSNNQNDEYLFIADDWTNGLANQGNYNDSITIISKRAYNSEKQIIFNLIYYDEAWKYLESLDNIPVFFHDYASKAYFALERYYYEGNSLPLTGIINVIDDTQVNGFLTSLMWEQEIFEFSTQVLKDCFNVIDQEFIQQEINELRKKVIQYRKQQDYSKLNEVMIRIMNLTRQIKAI
ncbi:DNA primase [Aerococcaceae bacterium WGS1372]